MAALSSLSAPKHTPSDTKRVSHICFGTELNNLGGLAAILTYPLDIETVEEEERQEKEDAEKAQAQEAESQDRQ